MEILLTQIFKRYGRELCFVEQVAKGFLSENYILVEGAKKYFLKKYRLDSPERITEVHRVKKYFSDNGIPVILPLAAENGDTFFQFNGAYYALFPFVDGRQPDRSDFTETEIYSLGETLGRIHRIGKDSSLKINEKFKPWNKDAALAKFALIRGEIKKKPLLDVFDAAALESIEWKTRLISLNTTTYEDLQLESNHLIHGDYIDHNVFFDDGGTVSHVFDFEKAGHFPRTYELFRSMLYTFDGEKLPDDLVRARQYFDAYGAAYPLSKDEIKNGLKLFYLKSIHGTWVESEHYLNNSTRVDCFLHPDLERIKFLSENLGFVEDVFIR